MTHEPPPEWASSQSWVVGWNTYFGLATSPPAEALEREAILRAAGQLLDLGVGPTIREDV
jgi:hypothetical protein